MLGHLWRGAGPAIWLLAVIATALAAGIWLGAQRPFAGPVNALRIDLAAPDALIRTRSLSELPRALAQAPWLRGVVTEDLVDYYESHPTRLTLLGTIKRLAYDHALSWPDTLLAKALDAPAEIALWRDDKGRLAHWLIVIEHGIADHAALMLARVALPDRQLALAARLPAGPPVYALTLSPRATWLVASNGHRLLIASDPGLLLDNERQLVPRAADVFATALTQAGQADSPFAISFGVGGADDTDEPGGAARTESTEPVRHRLIASARYLSFGYQHFFPGLDAWRIDQQSDGQWRLQMRAADVTLAAWRAAADQLWQAVPAHQAVCASLPVTPARAQPLVEALTRAARRTDDAAHSAGMRAPGDDSQAIGALLAALEPAAALCWNETGGLYAPLWALRLREDSATRHDAALTAAIDSALRATSDDGDQPTQREAMLPTPIDAEAVDGVSDGRRWQRTIGHEFGRQRSAGQPVDTVGLLRVGSSLLGTTDARSLEPAQALARGTYPSMRDTIDATTIVAIDAAALARLLERQTFITLRADTTPTFHRVARQLLKPRLDALAALGQVRIDLVESAVPSRVAATEALRWQSLRVTRQAAR